MKADGLYLAELNRDNSEPILFYNETEAVQWLKYHGGGTILRFKPDPTRYVVPERTSEKVDKLT